MNEFTEPIRILRNENYFKNYIKSKDMQNLANEKLAKNDILILPNKYIDEYYFAQETIDFVKFCRNNIQERVDILNEGDIEVRSLHSFDCWMPIFYIATQVLFPILINVISNYISEKIKGCEHEKANVHLKMIVKNKEKEVQINYDGDAKSFKKFVKEIDLDNLQND